MRRKPGVLSIFGCDTLQPHQRTSNRNTNTLLRYNCDFNLAGLGSHRSLLSFQSRHRSLLRSPRARQHDGILSLRSRCAVVVGRALRWSRPLSRPIRRWSSPGFVANNGIAGNWLWWNFVMSGMLTVFFYARLWRRAGVMTDIEFAELRYSGKPAAFLRGFRALYLGIPINCIIMGWVNLAMVKISANNAWRQQRPGDNGRRRAVAVHGVLYDHLRIMGSAGHRPLSVRTQDGDGDRSGRSGRECSGRNRRAEGEDNSSGRGKRAGWLAAFVLSRIDSAWMPAVTLFVYLAMNWWASWYPGAEPGGGGYVAQRIFSAREERRRIVGNALVQCCALRLRPWPWILTALASIILYPDLADKEAGYVMTLMDPNVFPSYLRGFMLAAFAAAYMSTHRHTIELGRILCDQ